jgi:transcriptional regulator with XRE-family HTH domain
MWSKSEAQALGDALRRLRLQSGLSQESLAHQAGITKNQLQLLEAGRSSGAKDTTGPSNPGIKTLDGLAEVFGIPISKVLSEAGL